MSHEHAVIDSDKYYIIDPIMRSVSNLNTENPKTVLMQRDHNSERITFEIPRYIEGHDMKLCNSIQIHFANTDRTKKNKSTDYYTVDDLADKTDDDTKLIFTWLVKNTATKYAGSLVFFILFRCITDEGVITYRWSTNVNDGISIVGLEDSTEDYTEEEIDELEAWKAGVLADIESMQTTLDETSHTHSNKKTLDLFSCLAVDTGFSQDASSDELKWRGQSVAFENGLTATISGVGEIEKDGVKYLRLSLSQGSVIYNKLPDYIDIPVSGVTDVKENPSPDITLNGSELDFGIGNTNDELSELKITLSEAQGDIKTLSNEIDALTEAQHSHGNKDILDSVTLDDLLTDAQRSAIDNDTVPLVTELPTDAKFGDICRYSRSNELSTDDGGKTIYFNRNWVNEVELAPMSSYRWELNAGSDFFAVRLTRDGGDLVDMNIHTRTYGYILYYQLSDDGVLSLHSQYESRYQDGNGKVSITEVPASVQIPELVYTSVHNANADFDIFYHEPKLMIYLGEWVEFPSKAELEALEDTVLNNYNALDSRVMPLEEVSHEHENKAIIDTITANMLMTPEQADAIAGITDMETRIAALETSLTGATATADEILETIGGEG